ncbi:MAG: hypothetical protein M3P48_09740, partial [Actinomycetota bacterium]|nr:hypothetical protein [Actinomycetota bacterium]
MSSVQATPERPRGNFVLALRRPAVVLLPLVGGLLATMASSPAQAGPTLSAVAAPTAAAAAARPSQCPDPFPVARVRAGMQGEGLTVTRGRTPQRFRVKVLGVLPNALAPGRDIILIDTSDLPGKRVIRQGGGIWAGMSGSPVYIGDKLLGAVSYGFTLAPSTIGGVTPAEDMYDVLRYRRAGTGAAAAAEPQKVAIPQSLRSRVAAAGAPAKAT